MTRTQALVVNALMIGVLLARAIYEFTMLAFTSLLSHVPGFADYWLHVADQVRYLSSPFVFLNALVFTRTCGVSEHIACALSRIS